MIAYLPPRANICGVSRQYPADAFDMGGDAGALARHAFL